MIKMKLKKVFLVITIALVFVIIGNLILEGDSIIEISDEIIIPVKAHIVVDNSGIYTSSRSEGNILSLLEKANEIWDHGNIHFQIEEIIITKVSFTAIPNVINGNTFEISNHENFEENKINLFLVQNLNNINGLSLKNINSIFVSDHTTVNDFRTTAHELGHILGLSHVEPSNRLLARGRNGEILTAEEISIARNNVKYLF